MPRHQRLSLARLLIELDDPGPDANVEAASSASIDLRDKRRACCRDGVREYLVWLVAKVTPGP